jgi:uncharacterized protein YqeY
MPLKERLVVEMNEAMRAGHQTKVSVIRMLRATIKNREIQKGKDYSLTDQEVLEVVASALKQRDEAIEQFGKGGRQDLVDKERAESEVLKSYLPEPITREQLLEEAKAVIKEVGAAGPKDMGKVMKALRPRVLGRIDGTTVSQVVKELLVQS